jgi:hypothetical protein
MAGGIARRGVPLVLVWAMVWGAIAPILVQPRRAEAVGPVAGALAAVGCTDPIGAPLCLGAAAALAWYVWSNGQSNSDTLTAVANAFVSWWQDNPSSSSRAAIESQFATHPAYLQPDWGMVSDWWEAFQTAGVNVGDWSEANYIVSGSTTLAVAEWRETTTYVAGTQFWTFRSYPLDRPLATNSGCAGATQSAPQFNFKFGRPALPAGSAGATVEVKMWAADVGPDTRVLDTVFTFGSQTTNLVINNTGTFGGSGNAGLSTTALRCSYWAAHAQYVVQYVIKAQADNLIPAIALAGGALSDGTISLGYPYTAWVATGGLVDPKIPSASAGVVYAPAGYDEFVGWNGVDAIPLSGGTTATVVRPVDVTVVGGTPGLTAEDQVWWAGLFTTVFGPMQTALESIRTGINAVTTTIFNVLTAVEALPVAIAALFDPAVAWADFWMSSWPGLQTTAAGVAPFCYSGAFSSSATLFVAGSGSGSVYVPLFGEVDLPVISDVAAVGQGTTTVLCGLLLVSWAAYRIRKVIGGE